MTVRYFIAVLLLALSIGGCAASTTSSASAGTSASVPGKPHAECLVCKCNNDLACVDVEVDADTPRTTYAGKQYYFCSDSCKREFERQPAKFANR